MSEEETTFEEIKEKYCHNDRDFADLCYSQGIIDKTKDILKDIERMKFNN